MPAVYTRDKGGKDPEKNVSSPKGDVPTTWKAAGWIDFTIERAADWIGQQTNDEPVKQFPSPAAKEENNGTSDELVIDKHQLKQEKKKAKKLKKMLYKIVREAAAKAMLLSLKRRVADAEKALSKRTEKTFAYERKCKEAVIRLEPRENEWDDWDA